MHKSSMVYQWFYRRCTNHSNPASMSCRTAGSPLPPQIEMFWFRISVPVPGVWFFVRPCEAANQPQKRTIVIGGTSVIGLQGFEGLNDSSIYGMSITSSLPSSLPGFPFFLRKVRCKSFFYRKHVSFSLNSYSSHQTPRKTSGTGKGTGKGT